MRIIIVDDSATFREATKHLLSSNPDFNIVAETNNSHNALKLINQLRPEIMLMDIKLPVTKAIADCKLLLEQNKHLKIIAITAYDEKVYVKEILKAGFLAVVNKNNVYDQLQTAIICTYNGVPYESMKFNMGTN